MQMDLITLDTAYGGAHIFVKNRTKSKRSSVKCRIRFAENDGSFLEGVFMPEKLQQFRVFTVFQLVYLDEAVRLYIKVPCTRSPD